MASHAPSHHHLHVPGTSVVHRLAPEAKVLGLLVFVIAVALTPREAIWAFGVDATVVLGVLALAGLPRRRIVRRLAVVVPFLTFAVLLPFIAGGDRVEVAGVALSRAGLWGSWNIAAKSLLGATAAIIVSATTPIADLLRGLQSLRVPTVVVGIISFMFRYLDVLAAQLQRMRTAMVARCHDARWAWQAKPIATSAGTLFVRSYERGERVHGAMLARGFDGTLPPLRPHDRRDAPQARSISALVPGGVAACLLVASLVAR
jgi:cobalt/nickel transport system permease protein